MILTIEMKRLIYLTLLLAATLQVKAQQINIETAEGTTSVDYATYETVRLTFANGKMQLMNDDTVVKTFDIKKISRIYFYSTNDIKTATTAGIPKPPLRMIAPSGAPMKKKIRQAKDNVNFRCHSKECFVKYQSESDMTVLEY